jgi:hypothetical protein
MAKATSDKPAKISLTAAQLKAFKSGVEVESFYRFVHENSLRNETKILLDIVVKRLKKKTKKAKVVH